MKAWRSSHPCVGAKPEVLRHRVHRRKNLPVAPALGRNAYKARLGISPSILTLKERLANNTSSRILAAVASRYKGVAGAGQPPSLLAVAKRNLHQTENTPDQSRQDVSVTSPKYMLHLTKYLTCFLSL